MKPGDDIKKLISRIQLDIA
ncbi:Protein of unknown function [Bacillus cytotoxicus]|nr:Protein of unknown function [Bacillus cytotoxicus]